MMKNPFIHNLNKKSVDTFTTDFGLYLRRKIDKPFKLLCNIFTNANIIRPGQFPDMTDDAYWDSLDTQPIPLSSYPLKKDKNNIILERYPRLNKDEPYIFVCNHTCPEDIETVLNVLDRNTWLILGSLHSLWYDREMYLLLISGMIPFDIADQAQRKGLMPKMERLIRTNSILIFPEGSHNYHPSNLINPLFDGSVNLALKTGRKIVLTTLVKDRDTGVSFIDVSNPIDVRTLAVPQMETEKQYVNALTAILRDKMATAVYHILVRHIPPIQRSEHPDIRREFQQIYVQESFSALKWRYDNFDAEYLVKKTAAHRAQEEVLEALSRLGIREFMEQKQAMDAENVAGFMREHWNTLHNKVSETVYRKR